MVVFLFEIIFLGDILWCRERWDSGYEIGQRVVNGGWKLLGNEEKCSGSSENHSGDDT